jgi:hypothetical protein
VDLIFVAEDFTGDLRGLPCAEVWTGNHCFRSHTRSGNGLQCIPQSLTAFARELPIGIASGRTVIVRYAMP